VWDKLMVLLLRSCSMYPLSSRLRSAMANELVLVVRPMMEMVALAMITFLLLFFLLFLV
jgi:hypothetical protein